MSYDSAKTATGLSAASRLITTNMTTRQAAMVYAQAGVPIFPVHGIRLGEGGVLVCSCGEAECQQPGKKPAIKEWPIVATTNLDIVASWWRRYPDANIGHPIQRGMLVVDVDDHRNKREDDELENPGVKPPRREPGHGWESFADVMLLQPDIMETISVSTGGGGLHCFLVDEQGRELKSRNGAWPGIDLRAEGTYVILPPSMHKSGRSYEWSV